MQTAEYFTKIEGQKYPTTSPCSELIISEDDWNTLAITKKIYIKKEKWEGLVTHLTEKI